MKKIISASVFTVITSVFIFYSSICFAASTTYVRSGIYKPIISYTCDEYYDVFETGDVEDNIYRYYQERKMNLQITKKITSQAYIEQIRDFILYDWTPPFYLNREDVANKFDKAFDDLYIVQVVEFDFRRKFRNAIVMEEVLWGVKENSSPLIILSCAGDENLPGNRIVYNIDYDEEYGQIANDAVAFLESIKDIYFDPKVHAEYERKEKNEEKMRGYLKCWTGNLTKLVGVDNNSILLYADIPSFHPTKEKNFFEGWLKMDANPPLEVDNRKYSIQSTKIYCRIDYREGVQYNLASVEIEESGQEHWNVLTKAEIFENSPWRERLWEELAKKFRLAPVNCKLK